MRPIRLSRDRFSSTRGAIDLASIMVGVLVIGIIAGVIAAVVFAVIPWAQDNAAKQSLEAVKTSEQVQYTNTAGTGAASYADIAGLVTKKLIQDGRPDLDALTNTDASCYVGVATSATGNRFWVSDAHPQPQLVTSSTTTGCVDVGSDPQSLTCTVHATDPASLVNDFNSATDGTVVCLDNDITNAPPTSGPASSSAVLAVPSGVAMAVNLQGHALNATSQGFGDAAIGVPGTAGLYLGDSVGGGTITANGGVSAGDYTNDPAQPYAFDDGSGYRSTVGAAAIGGDSGDTPNSTLTDASAGTITINGITVHASTLATDTAVIGGGTVVGSPWSGTAFTGGNAGPIRIEDADVEVTSTGDGIGSGHFGHVASVVIQHSTVRAEVSGGAAIGGGYGGSSGPISILDSSDVNATGSYTDPSGSTQSNGAAIGSSQDLVMPDGTVDSSYATLQGVQSITIDHSTVTASASNGAAIGGGYSTTSGDIAITGSSTVVANSDGGAGIGQGTFYSDPLGSATGAVTIDHSTVTASASNGPGIGGSLGPDAKPITITDSTIDASGSAAGIGGANWVYYGQSPDITITGSHVTAAAQDAAGIGAGYSQSIGSVTISGSDIRSSSSSGGAGIGGGWGGPVDSVSITNSTIDAEAPNYTAIGGGYAADINSVLIDDSKITAVGGYTAIGSSYGASITTLTIKNGSDITASTVSGSGAAIGSGYDGNAGTISISDSTVHADTSDGPIVGAWHHAGTIAIDNSTVIGSNSGGNTVAGIGAGYQSAGDGVDEITITGGSHIDVESNGVGIGSVWAPGLGTITISDSTVKATATGYGAGIGAGPYNGGEAAAGTITITASDITAQGGSWSYGAGIGSSSSSSGDETDQTNNMLITIKSGTVQALGGDYAAGIGGGMNSASGTIVIEGGTVTATPGVDGDSEAIGHGDDSIYGVPRSSHVTITGGTVNGIQH